MHRNGKSKIVVLISVILTLIGPVSPLLALSTTLDFTSLSGGYAVGSYDQLVFNGLTISARTGVLNNGDPWGPNPPARNGVPGKVYWGNLGNLDVQNASYFGLGVLNNGQTPVDSTTGPITFRETLLFHFETPQIGQTPWPVQAGAERQVEFTALGLNALQSGGSGVPADNMRVWIKVVSGETSFVDINAGAIGLFGPDYGSAIDYILRYANYADERVTDFAVEQIWGNASNPNRRFGIGSVTYNAVPEPANMIILLGLGLTWVEVLRRKYQK